MSLAFWLSTFGAAALVLVAAYLVTRRELRAKDRR
jgi:hypothetical protein